MISLNTPNLLNMSKKIDNLSVRREEEGKRRDPSRCHPSLCAPGDGAEQRWDGTLIIFSRMIERGHIPHLSQVRTTIPLI